MPFWDRRHSTTPTCPRHAASIKGDQPPQFTVLISAPLLRKTDTTLSDPSRYSYRAQYILVDSLLQCLHLHDLPTIPLWRPDRTQKLEAKGCLFPKSSALSVSALSMKDALWLSFVHQQDLLFQQLYEVQDEVVAFCRRTTWMRMKGKEKVVIVSTQIMKCATSHHAEWTHNEQQRRISINTHSSSSISSNSYLHQYTHLVWLSCLQGKEILLNVRMRSLQAIYLWWLLLFCSVKRGWEDAYHVISLMRQGRVVVVASWGERAMMDDEAQELM